MAHYSSIVIIYNPNSTGNGKRMAHDLFDQLKKRLPGARINLKATKYAGHGEKLAYRSALFTRHALIVSASGDGGYSDIINGAMRAAAYGRRVTTALLPAGNANDHFNSLHEGDLVERIVKGEARKIDLLKLTLTSKGKKITRYGHSYIGLGLTPQAGRELNKTDLNFFKEIKIILQVLLRLKSVRIIHDGAVHRYDSLLFSNIGRMSKVLKLPKEAQPDDGKFEVIKLYNRNKFHLISTLLHASTVGMSADAQVESYKFTTTRPTLIQIDGEIQRADANSLVTVGIAAKALNSIV